MQRPGSHGALQRLSANGNSDSLTRRSSPDLEIVMDPLFEDMPSSRPSSPPTRVGSVDPLFDDMMPSPKTKTKSSGSPRDDDDDSLFFSTPAQPTTSQYTFTWRGWKVHIFQENKISTIVLLVVTLLLFLGYLIHYGGSNEESTTSSNFFNFFAVHYAIGALVGLSIVIGLFHYRQRPPPESGILLGTIIWSAYPDIILFVYGIPHQPWMNIFFFHGIIEASFSYLWVVLLLLDVGLIFVYAKLIEESRPKTSARSLVAML
mmetsp:Transcript_21759/g.29923  ORF Transcript_21759/g.29923 Transcript_21759/m.29923 type:complete len:261 (+) Transcript_21759:194-976(+)|eukprot:CAMPEP_0201482292 /NCGR_PEP_ID=MMETSP0151_2-20130828/6575_1 /ASSEMBLY_ACC=CAM_ASM_000257 /TAXON_ID=200890 /ORGANISM="Paramoeba atlantica, Strain 621/1 / CCAP 1560/9" /LENGTH=260 /DNA_ID=CAMNT_0047864933 /DNA_START=197 /DNA_END=979 /DNA_ORIENTATION=+